MQFLLYCEWPVQLFCLVSLSLLDVKYKPTVELRREPKMTNPANMACSSDLMRTRLQEATVAENDDKYK